jgi:hypothetical protein
VSERSRASDVVDYARRPVLFAGRDAGDLRRLVLLADPWVDDTLRREDPRQDAGAHAGGSQPGESLQS